MNDKIPIGKYIKYIDVDNKQHDCVEIKLKNM